MAGASWIVRAALTQGGTGKTGAAGREKVVEREDADEDEDEGEQKEERDDSHLKCPGEAEYKLEREDPGPVRLAVVVDRDREDCRVKKDGTS